MDRITYEKNYYSLCRMNGRYEELVISDTINQGGTMFLFECTGKRFMMGTVDYMGKKASDFLLVNNLVSIYTYNINPESLDYIYNQLKVKAEKYDLDCDKWIEAINDSDYERDSQSRQFCHHKMFDEPTVHRPRVTKSAVLSRWGYDPEYEAYKPLDYGKIFLNHIVASTVIDFDVLGNSRDGKEVEQDE